MSSFYDDASLVVIPSGYKTSKVYAEKPTDGSGDLAFTRTGDTATRVNSAGLIEEVRTNLLTRSQEFDNAAWTKDRTTVTANTTTAPDGTTTADKVVDTLQGNNAYRIYNGITLSAISYSASFYVKAAEYNWVYIRIGNSLRVWFNVSTGVVGNNDSGITGTIQSVGNGWFRCTAIIATATAGGGFSLLGLTNANGIETYTPSTGGQGVFVWGAQLETTDFGATPYIPTTTAAVSVGPVANVPRLDYLGSTCPRLLLEPQRTNLVTYSEQLNNAAWGKTNITITANNATSPDGYQNADTSLADGVNAVHIIASNLISFTSGTAYSFSVFAKKGTNNFMQLIISSTVGGMFANFDLNNGTVGTLGTLTGTTPTSSIVDYGNGWYRCVINFTPTATTSAYANFVIVTSASAARAEANTLSTSVILWGAQLELGSFATSYVPTLAASATRGADACSKTGISSLIGQTEGVAFIDFVWNGLTGVGSYPRIIELATDANNIIQLYSIAGTTSWGWDIFNGGVVQFTGSSTMALGRNKIAIGYKLNDMVVYKNGTLLASDTSCTVPATSALGVTGIFNGAGGAQLAASVNQTLLFKTRLTNAELAELTTI